MSRRRVVNDVFLWEEERVEISQIQCQFLGQIVRVGLAPKTMIT
jgi:hypothetical protein